MVHARAGVKAIGFTTLSLTLFSFAPAFAQTQPQSHKIYSFEFTRVVDTTKEFSSFGGFPAMNNHGDVAFTAVRYGNAGVFRVREEQERVVTIASSSDGFVAFSDQGASRADSH
jgi:hypothetical protein